MKNRVERSIGLRAFNALCAILLLIAVFYTLAIGFHAAALAAVVLAITGAATPVVISSEGTLEIFLGTFEAMIDGIVAIVEGITSAIASLFG